TIEQGKEETMLQLNIMAVYKLTRLFLGQMLARNAGSIINISSATAFQPMPKMSTYAATKAFVKQLSESISEELKMQNSSVHIMAVCPAAIADTKFKSAASMDRVKTFDGLAVTTAAEVAKDTWAGFKNKKSLVVTGSRMRLLHFFTQFVPSGLTQFFVRKEMEES
ncbi:MAG: SDR family NAD(P)-dependent oxidoreductase, partial [Chloroflexota bacterium]